MINFFASPMHILVSPYMVQIFPWALSAILFLFLSADGSVQGAVHVGKVASKVRGKLLQHAASLADLIFIHIYSVGALYNQHL